MDSYSFGMGIFITIFAVVVLVFVGYVAFDRGKADVHSDIKEYGCEKIVAVWDAKIRERVK